VRIVATFQQSDACAGAVGEAQDMSIECGEYAQLTYTHLRGDQGETIAVVDEDGYWMLEERYDSIDRYSDVVLHMEDS